jgi:hypothetical protein
MVTKKPKQPARFPQRRHADDPTSGPWLCNVAAGCDEQAVVQATVTCTGCDDRRLESEAGIERKRKELAHHEELEGVVLKSARDEDRDLTELDKLALQVAAMKRQQLGADLEALTAAAAAVADEHTHPVFACAKHEQLLQP